MIQQPDTAPTIAINPTTLDAVTNKGTTNSATFTACPPAEPPLVTTNEPCLDFVDAPPGSVLSLLKDAPHSDPSTAISNFPYGRVNLVKIQTDFNNTTTTPHNFGTIIWIALSPHIFGLQNNIRLFVRIQRHSTSLMVGGANICIMGDLPTMVGIVDIPPMPISVTLVGMDVSEDDCGTKQGYTPLRVLMALSTGSSVSTVQTLSRPSSCCKRS
jgi:hypothetical protein